MRTENTPAEDTPGRECPHDVFGLRPHKGTMWMSNDRVPLENIESPYGGGVSSLPGATGDLLPMMFPVAPVLLTYPKQSALGVSVDSWRGCRVRNHWSSPCSERCRSYNRMRQTRQSVWLWHRR